MSQRFQNRVSLKQAHDVTSPGAQAWVQFLVLLLINSVNMSKCFYIGPGFC